MLTELWTVTPDTGTVSAARLASDYKIRHLLVLEDGNLVGVVSARRLMAARPGQMVGEVMATPVLSIAPETTVLEAIGIMEEQKVGYLPIIGSGFLVGYVTDRQLIGAAEPDSTVNAEIRRQPD